MTGHTMMEPAIARIFVNHRLPSQFARSFAAGMCRYFDTQHPRCLIMTVPATEFWPYTPHFRMAAAAALRVLFDARITGVSMCPAAINEQTITLVDDTARRWLLTVEPAGANVNHIYAHAPRPNTPSLAVRQLTARELLNLPDDVQLIVASTDDWG